jgi:hypothetical protein
MVQAEAFLAGGVGGAPPGAFREPVTPGPADPPVGT